MRNGRLCGEALIQISACFVSIISSQAISHRGLTKLNSHYIATIYTGITGKPAPYKTSKLRSTSTFSQAVKSKMPEGSSARLYMCNCTRFCRGEARVVKRSVYYAHAVHRRILPPIPDIIQGRNAPSSCPQPITAVRSERPSKRTCRDAQPSSLCSESNVSSSLITF